MGTIESHLKYTVGKEYDFSEMNLVNNNGFDPSDGGDAFMSMAYLSRGDGPIDESDDPYEYNRYYSPLGIGKKVLVTDMQKDYEGALELFQSAIEKNPDKGMYYFYEGKCYQKLSDIDAALDSFDRGIVLSDDYFEKLNIEKGDVLAQHEDYENALECYEDVLSVRKSEIALHVKATCLWKLGRFEDACAAYEDLLYFGYSYEYVIELAQCYFEACHYEGCMYACDYAVELNPKSMTAPMLESKVCLERGDYYGAESYMDDMQAVYDEYWKGKNDSQVESMMCEAYAVKADSLLEFSYCGKSLKALEESAKYGECKTADSVRDKIDEKLDSYETFSADAPEVENDHVFTVRFNKKVDYRTIDENIFVLDSNGNTVETSA